MKVNQTKLVIGLGNPGEEYENTYHNAGALFTEYLMKNAGLKWQIAKNFRFAKFDGKIVARTNVFMNESGKAASGALKYFSLKPEQIIAVHDDSDIELGKYKLQFNRSSAGHKGVESVIHALKTQKFWRLRIGIGKFTFTNRNSDARKGRGPDINRRGKAGDLVLRKISNEDLKKINSVFEQIIEVELLRSKTPVKT